MIKRILLFLLICHPLSATNYYVRNGGDDGAAGISDATAWATITKVNATSFSPGDTIKFKCSSLFRGRILFTSDGTIGNPIVLTKYGSGKLPIISGQELLASSLTWKDKGDDVYGAYTSYGSSTCMNMVEDSIPLSIVNNAYTGTRAEITDFGQWTFNSTSDCVWVKTFNGVNPSTIDITLSKHTAAINTGYSYATKSDYVYIENLRVIGGYYNIQVYGPTGIVIRNCILESAYGDAIKVQADYPADPDDPSHVEYSKDLIFEYNDIKLFGESGIDNTGGENVTIRYNKIHNSVSNRAYNASGSNVNGIMTKNYSVNVIINNNEIYDLKTTMWGALSIGGQTSTGWNVEAYKTYVKNNLIYNINNSYNSSRGYIIGITAADSAFIYNNTITNCIVEDDNPGNAGLILFDISKTGTPSYDNDYVYINNNIFWNNRIESGMIISETDSGYVQDLICNYNLFDTLQYSDNIIGDSTAFNNDKVTDDWTLVGVTASICNNDAIKGKGSILFVSQDGTNDRGQIVISDLVVDTVYYACFWAKIDSTTNRPYITTDYGMGNFNVSKHFKTTEWTFYDTTFIATETSGTWYFYAAQNDASADDSLFVDNIYLGKLSDTESKFIYSDTTYNYKNWQVTGFDVNSYFENPQLNNQYFPCIESVCIDNGTNENLYQVRTFGLNPDIGFYEKFYILMTGRRR